jgi:hypothetical protein
VDQNTWEPIAIGGSAALAENELLFLEAHSESAQAVAGGAAWVWHPNCWFTYADGTGGEDCSTYVQVTSDRNDEGWQDGNHPLGRLSRVAVWRVERQGGRWPA